MQKLIDTVENLIGTSTILPCHDSGMTHVVISSELLYKANAMAGNILDGNAPDDSDYTSESITILLDMICEIYDHAVCYPPDQYGTPEMIVPFNYFNDLIIAFDNVWEEFYSDSNCEA